jgi:serine/threonine protein kinase/ABC-type branched-subunit amino acid transport system substrate-binding protein
MAAVYLAHDPRLDRQIALKLMNRELSADRAFVARFEREAKTIAGLNHKAIVSLYDFGEVDGWLYLVMPYMKGGTLKELIADGPLAAEIAYDVVRRIGSALDKSHSQNIIHRDLKPANILLDEEQEPYVSDFGIVKIAAGDTDYLTESGQTIGTFAYMSPEQVMGQELDGRSDIYALGIVLYEMLTGKHPYSDAATSGAMAVAHTQSPVPDVTEDNPALPPTIKGVIRKALAKDAADRFSSGSDMAAAVEAALIAKPGSTSMVGLNDEAETGREDRPTKLSRPSASEPDLLQPVAANTQSEMGAKTPAKKGRRARTWFLGCTAVLVVACIGIAIVAGPSFIDNPTPTPRMMGTLSATPNVVEARPTEEWLPCNDELGCVQIDPDQPIKLASVLDLEAFISQASGLDDQKGIDLAVDLRGTLLDHEIVVQHENEDCDDEDSQALVEKIVSDPQIVAVIGLQCSGSSAVSAMGIVSDAGYVLLSPTNSDPAMTDPARDWSPGFLRTVARVDYQGQALAEFAFDELGVRRAATIRDGFPYSESLVTNFIATFEQLGGEIIADRLLDESADVPIVLAELAIDNPELIYSPVTIDQIELLANAASQMNRLEEVALVAADWSSVAFLLAIKDEVDLEGWYLTDINYQFDNLIYENEFLPAFIEVYGEQPGGAAYAFDATNMVLDAVTEVAEALDDGTLLIGRKALRDALYDTSDFEGSTGTLSCNEYGDCADPLTAVYQVQGEQVARIWPNSDRTDGMVNVAGSYQGAVGCHSDWDPACRLSALTEEDSGLWTAVHELPAGDYEVKVALNGDWPTNYGVDGVPNGDNYQFNLDADGRVGFIYDPDTNKLAISIP